MIFYKKRFIKELKTKDPSATSDMEKEENNCGRARLEVYKHEKMPYISMINERI